VTSVRPDEPCHADVLLELANGRAAVNPEREMQNYAIADDAADPSAQPPRKGTR
jgi:hypothetical protein